MDERHDRDKAMTTLGVTFIASVRKHFGDLPVEYGLHEVGAEDNLNFAAVVMKSPRYYLRFTCDFRDRWMEVGLGRLSEGIVPPIPVAPPRASEQVRELPSAIVIWLGSADKQRAFALGSYPEETPESLDSAVQRLAGAYKEYARPLLEGDENRWRRAADLAISREWRDGERPPVARGEPDFDARCRDDEGERADLCPHLAPPPQGLGDHRQ